MYMNYILSVVAAAVVVVQYGNRIEYEWYGRMVVYTE